MEQIAKLSFDQIKDDATPDKIETDWITNFFDKCRIVSDADMQSLWSKVLSGEANAPGAYSQRTVNFLSDLDKSEAKLFSNLCDFGWVIGNVVPLIYDTQHEIYNKNNINFNSLGHLESIGLIQFHNLTGFQRLGLPKTLSVSYYGQQVECDMPKETDNSMNIGKVMLTRIGEELAPICGSKPVDGFMDYILDQWKSKNYLKKENVDEVA